MVVFIDGLLVEAEGAGDFMLAEDLQGLVDGIFGYIGIGGAGACVEVFEGLVLFGFHEDIDGGGLLIGELSAAFGDNLAEAGEGVAVAGFGDFGEFFGVEGDGFGGVGGFDLV